MGVVSVDVELPSGSSLPTEREWMTDGVTHGMTISGSLSPEVLCTMLEQLLGRPVVDETGLGGVFKVQFRAKPGMLTISSRSCATRLVSP